MITLEKFRITTAVFIVSAFMLLLVSLGVFYGAGGFTKSELFELGKYLAPIKVLYVTAAAKFIYLHQTNGKKVSSKIQNLQPAFKWTCFFFIYLPIIFLQIMVVLTGIGLCLPDTLKGFSIATESILGVYIGLYITYLFPTTKN